jgi:hypothetical protein
VADDQKFHVTLGGEGIKVDKDVAADVARRIMNIVLGGEDHRAGPGDDSAGAGPRDASATSTEKLTAKAFMAAKRPGTDVERVTCLAFYLTHTLGTPTFQTRDISKLNADAHQPKLANPTVATNNASRQRYLTPAGGGKKRITTLGEEVVRALPDRAAVNQVLASQPGGRRKRSKSRTRSKTKTA